MDDYSFYFLVLVLAAAGYYYINSNRVVVHGRIKKVKPRKMSEVEDGGKVRISGKVIYVGEVLVAPLSKRKCVYYHVTVKGDRGRGNRRKAWFEDKRVDIDEEWAGDLVITDGENYALIHTQHVQSVITKDQTVNSGFWNISTPELKALLKRKGYPSADFMGWSLDLYAKEGVIEEGETVTVAGRASWRAASEFRLKIPGNKILFIEALNKNGVYLTDDPYV